MRTTATWGKRLTWAVMLALFAIACSSNGGAANCGAEGEPCCNGDACSAGLSCAAGTCSAGTVSYLPVEGAACATPEGSLVCGTGTDGTQNVVLYCQASLYTKAFACSGLETCANINTHDSVYCGSVAYAMTGAPCAGTNEAACSFDLAKVEQCVNGAWVDAVHCPPSSCTVNAASSSMSEFSCPGVACANCGETVGDLCHIPAGEGICSTDLSSILECSNGRTVVEQSCGSGKCAVLVANGSTGLGCQ